MPRSMLVPPGGVEPAELRLWLARSVGSARGWFDLARSVLLGASVATKTAGREEVGTMRSVSNCRCWYHREESNLLIGLRRPESHPYAVAGVGSSPGCRSPPWDLEDPSPIRRASRGVLVAHRGVEPRLET